MKYVIFAVLLVTTISNAMHLNPDIAWLQEKIDKCKENKYWNLDCVFMKSYIDKFFSPMCVPQPTIPGIAKREAICRLLYDAMADEKFASKIVNY
ncbi:hypothetical protein BH09DEP1_BH09DEP1_2950 [soil metagenome]